MTSGSSFRVCLLGLTCVGGVLGATLATYNSSVTPVGGEGPTAEQTTLPIPASSPDHTAPLRTHLAAAPLPLTGEKSSGGFERYIAGLSRLSSALMNPGHDWEVAAEAHDSAIRTYEESNGNTDFRHNVQKLFAFTGTMQRLSDSVKQLRFNDGDREMQDDPTPSADAETNLHSRLHEALKGVVADLSRLYDNFWYQSGEGEDTNEEKGKTVQKEDAMQVLVENLETLSRAHSNYTVAANPVNTLVDRIIGSSNAEVTATGNFESTPTRTVESSTPEEPAASTLVLLDWEENQRGLLQVATQLKALLRMESVESDRNGTDLTSQSSTISSTSTTSTTTTTPITTTTTSSPREPSEQPCHPPFELIAYRMCILQEMELRLSWDDAQEFCRERGAELAEDMVVIKTRRYLNDLYGEEGTRTRWPIWVGGRKAGETWVWEGGQQVVPEFLWATSEPREFSSHLVPEGQCMILDGYRRFYGATLPCHLRRRFVCQRNN